MRNTLAKGALLFLIATTAAFATEKTWQLPNNSSATPGWSLADLDGDSVADLAAAGPGLREGNKYVHKIQIDLSHSPSASFDVHGGTESIRLSLRDIDGDQDRDLVVLEPSSLTPIAVWLNDGAGHFTEGDLSSYASTIGRPGPHSFTSELAAHDTLTGLSDDQVPLHSLLIFLTPAVASRAPAAGSSVSPRSTGVHAFAPRGPPSLS